MTGKIEFRLSPPIKSEAPTYASFSVLLDDEALWPIAGTDAAIDIFIDDVLDYLTDFWASLLLRQTYPLPFSVQPARPAALYSKAASRWLDMPESQVELEQSAVMAFEEAHNFAKCLDGQFSLPPLWLLRDREELIIDTGERLIKVDFADAIGALARLGDAIALRLKDTNSKSALTSAWQSRNNVDGIRMVELRAGLSTAKAEELVRSKYLSVPPTLSEAQNDNDEIVIAARMAGALSLEEIKRIIQLAKSFALNPNQPLVKIASGIRNSIDNLSNLKPFDQGVIAARLVREKCGIDGDGALDIHAFAKDLGVEVKEIGISLQGVMGLAISGTRYGPGVLLNKKYKNLSYVPIASRDAMLRYTLAHELCHLILDSEHSFTAVDVLNGRMNPAIESRAQSFAGEFLLPTRLARSVWEAHGSPRTSVGLEAVIAEAVQKYRVTRNVAAWKIEHAAQDCDVDLHYVLQQLAPFR